MKSYRKMLIPGIVLLVLITTNPSIYAFKSYLGVNSYKGLKKPVNLFIAAIYKQGGREYIGVLGNFWRIDKYANIEVYQKHLLDSTKKADSISMTDSTKMTVDTLMKPSDWDKYKVKTK